MVKRPKMKNATATANKFDTDSYLYHNLGAATGTPTVSSSYVGSQKNCPMSPVSTIAIKDVTY